MGRLLGKAGAESKCTTREETALAPPQLGGHRDRELWRRLQAPHLRESPPLGAQRRHPLAEASRLRAPQAVKRLAGPPEVLRDDGGYGKEKVSAI